jgi:hypothetical protein
VSQDKLQDARDLLRMARRSLGRQDFAFSEEDENTLATVLDMLAERLQSLASELSGASHSDCP